MKSVYHAVAAVRQATIQFGIVLTLFGATHSVMAAERFVIRDGCQNVAAKLKAGQNVVVVSLGGSITKAGGDAGFSQAVPQWLQEKYSNAKVTAKNAGINGTDSGFGAARIDRDVIAYKPDLVVVEFAVNDGNNDRSVPMERIVRKIWQADPNCDIIFIYTVEESLLEDWRKEELPKSSASHERVAEYYKIPSVRLSVDLLAALDKGAAWNTLMRDGCHPSSDGYAIYVGQMTDALTAAFAVGKPGRTVVEATLKPGLEINPVAKPAEPLPEPTPFKTADSRIAVQTFELPAVGKYWRESPELSIEGKQLWGLSYQLFKQGDQHIGGKMNAEFGLDRSNWNPMDWLEERSFFNGSEGMALAAGDNFSARENNLPVLTFIAPETGRYAFTAVSKGIKIWSHHNRIGMQIAHFPWGKNIGTSVGWSETNKTAKKPLDMQGELDLVAGEVLAFSVDTDVFFGGGGAIYSGFVVRVGLMDKAK